MDSLIKILGRLIDNKEYCDEEVKQMTGQRKSEQIQKYPVTRARKFEHMVQFTTLLKAQTVKLILLIAVIPSSTMYLHVEQISDNSRRAFKVQDFF